MNNRKDSRKLKRKANELLERGECSRAFPKILKAIELDPTRGLLYECWLDILSKQAKINLKEAEIRLSRASRISPNDSEIYVKWGLLLAYQSKYDQAITNYKRAIDLDSNNMSVYEFWGEALMRLEKYEDAALKFEIASIIDPDDFDIYNSWILALHKQEKYKEVILICNKAIQKDTEDPLFYFNKGIALYHLNCYEEAKLAYIEGIELLHKTPAEKVSMIKSIEESLIANDSKAEEEIIEPQSQHKETKSLILNCLLDQIKALQE